jgi:hypothetical protein
MDKLRPNDRCEQANGKYSGATGVPAYQKMSEKS